MKKLFSILVMLLSALFSTAQTTHQVTVCGLHTPINPVTNRSTPLPCGPQLVPSPDGTTLSFIADATTLNVAANKTGSVTKTTGNLEFTTPPLISGSFFNGGVFDTGGSFSLQIPDFEIDYLSSFLQNPKYPTYYRWDAIAVVKNCGVRPIPGCVQGSDGVWRITYYRYRLYATLNDGSAFYVVLLDTINPYDGVTPLDVDTIGIGLNQ